MESHAPRRRLPLFAAGLSAVIACVGCVVALTWMAVVLASDAANGGQALPWAVGCAVVALVAFAMALGALLSPRRRVALAGAAGFLLVLLATSVLAVVMSGAAQEVDVPAARSGGLLERPDR
jgi:hypothetical protein